MVRRRPTTDVVRAWVSALVAALVAVVVIAVVPRVTDLRLDGPLTLLVTTFVVVYPVFAVLYLTWGSITYARLGHDALRRAAAADHRDESHPVNRLLGMSGTTNTTMTGAVVAVVVTVGIAVTPAFRAETAYLVAALLTVASAWALMVYTFGQAYLRLGVQATDEEPIYFPFTRDPTFSDYLTLAVLMSVMAATVSAEIRTRPAWRLVRGNVLVAFAFNTVIIAMTVSLLFGSISG